METIALVNRRIILSQDAFVEIVVWQVPRPVRPSAHNFKYRLAYIVAGECVVRHDNEHGKGDHKHTGSMETPYTFSDPDQLMADFYADIARWNYENGRT